MTMRKENYAQKLVIKLISEKREKTKNLEICYFSSHVILIIIFFLF
jgi:hypothetical protein